jgi:hypothetical protein
MRPLAAVIALTALSSTLTACDRSTPALRAAEVPAAARPSLPDPVPTRQYGAPIAVGRGQARTYIAVDPRTNAPVEVGVALDSSAFEGLPAPSPMRAASNDGHEHVDSRVFDLPMPAPNATPYKFLELDWNPGGHEPPGVYDTPHFDFHFYTVDPAVRNAIDPKLLGEEQFRAKSAVLPPEAERAPTFVALAPPGAPVMAVPRMGVHWIDPKTPELQGLFGRPEAFRPFTTTFIHGSWDGRFIFDEPMVTRAFILGRKTAATPAQRDTVIPLPTPERFTPAGYYPAAYRILYDADAREYRIALTQLTKRNN